jgi:hypothetical protein
MRFILTSVHRSANTGVSPRGGLGPRLVPLHLYVADVDVIYKSAILAGGKPLNEP